MLLWRMPESDRGTHSKNRYPGYKAVTGQTYAKNALLYAKRIGLNRPCEPGGGGLALGSAQCALQVCQQLGVVGFGAAGVAGKYLAIAANEVLVKVPLR